MLDIKLIASDIDGTLLPYGDVRVLSQATRDMIAECRRRGILFVVSSGRCYGDARAFAQEAGLNTPIICTNGACIIDEKGKIIHEAIFTDEQSKICYDIIKDCGWVIHSYVPGRMIRLNLETMGFAGPEPRSRFLGDFEFVENNPARMEAEGHEHVYKYEVYSKDRALLERLRAELIEAGFSVSSSVPDDIEITAPGVDKGSGVMWLAEQIGATVDQTMAFGDHLNDMPMIKRVGWPVAMGNGVDELKAAARIIAPDAADDGVARVVRHHVFGENCL